MGRGIFYLGILAGLAALSTWFLSSLESSLREGTTQDDKTPNLYIDRFIATRMNVQGLPQYTLASPHLVQLPGEQGTWLDQPDLDMYQDDVPTWLMRATRGWVAADNETIRLQGGVSVTRPASSGKPPLVVTTSSLLLLPRKKYAETPDPVRMETPGGVITAVGLKARLNDQQLELLSDVRGNYAPPKP